MEQLDFDLDAKGFDVFEALYENGGEATTTEVKDYTGIDKNAIVHYRFDKLEEHGIVEVGVGEAAGNRVPPKKATLTEKGHSLSSGGFFEKDETHTIVERMELLEGRMDSVVSEFHEVKDEFENWKMGEDGEEVDVTDLLEQFEHFERMTANVPDDALEQAMNVESRVSSLEERQRMKGKYRDGLRSLDRGREGSPYIDGRDLCAMFDRLEAELSQIARALEGAGIGAENDEFLGRDYYLALENADADGEGGDVYDPTEEFDA